MKIGWELLDIHEKISSLAILASSVTSAHSTEHSFRPTQPKFIIFFPLKAEVNTFHLKYCTMFLSQYFPIYMRNSITDPWKFAILARFIGYISRTTRPILLIFELDLSFLIIFQGKKSFLKSDRNYSSYRAKGRTDGQTFFLQIWHL